MPMPPPSGNGGLGLSAIGTKEPSPGVQLMLSGEYWDGSRVLSFHPLTASVLDQDGSRSHHLRVSISRSAGTLSLWIDGQMMGSVPWSGAVNGPGGKTLCVTRMDEVRLYNRSPPPADETWRLGRFARSGSYASPLYHILGEPAVLGWAQWTGILPAGFPPTSISVIVEGHDAAGVVRTFLLGAGGEVANLAPLGALESFRYRVLFDVPASVDPLVDTPVFESIWFTLRPAASRPSWTPAANPR